MVKMHIPDENPTKYGPIWVKKPYNPWKWCWIEALDAVIVNLHIPDENPTKSGRICVKKTLPILGIDVVERCLN